MSEISRKVGARIRYLRTLKELSQEKLALDAGLNPAFLGHLERGLKSPTVDTLYKISSTLNITLSELLKVEETSNIGELEEKILLSLKNVDKEDLATIAHIITEIIKLKKR